MVTACAIATMDTSGESAFLGWLAQGHSCSGEDIIGDIHHRLPDLGLSLRRLADITR